MSSGEELGASLAWLLDPWLVEVPTAYVTGVCADSRSVEAGDLFTAFAGSSGHGLDFIEQAITRGAAAIVWEPVEGLQLESARRLTAQAGLPLVAMPELGRRLGAIAGRFYGDPSRLLEVAAVTGTDGKTSVAHYIAQLLSAPESPWGVIGTLGYGLIDSLHQSRLTTPDGALLQKAFAHCRSAGCGGVALEASSHALEQGRLGLTSVDVAVLTHVGRDHLDYHGSPEAYAYAKRRLFERSSLRAQVVNLDDELGRRLYESAGGAVFTYSLKDPAADLYAKSVQPQADGLVIELCVGTTTYSARLPLLGRFNAANALAAVGAALALGRPISGVIERLNSLNPIAGRMEQLSHPEGPLVVVDYAHTPGALQHSLAALREHCQGEVTVVFGCGGERDPGKRPLMGQVAARYADSVIITDDNPRYEDAATIRRAISQGISQFAPGVVPVIEPDRAAAIEHAICTAAQGDGVLIAGKGHESTQQIGAECRPCSDREVVLEIVRREGVR